MQTARLFFVLWVILGWKASEAQVPQTEIAVCSFRFYVNAKLTSSVHENEFVYNDKLHKTNQESLALIKSAYDYLTDRITRNTTIDFLPVDAISPYLELTPSGYPNATLREASKKADFKYYVCIDVYIDGERTQKYVISRPLPDGFNSGDYEHKFITTFPNFKVRLIIGDHEGKKLNTYSGSFQMSDSIIVETKSISSRQHNGDWQKDEFYNPEKIPFQVMMELAVSDLIGKLEEYSY